MLRLLANLLARTLYLWSLVKSLPAAKTSSMKRLFVKLSRKLVMMILKRVWTTRMLSLWLLLINNPKKSLTPSTSKRQTKMLVLVTKVL